MANYALVVGCDAYPHLRNGDLRGAVADALAMRDWLLRNEGGVVPEDNLHLLISCSKEGSKPEPGTVYRAAEKKNFAPIVAELTESSAPKKHDRLFVYLAGHGCRTDPLNPLLAQDAFAFTEFTADDPSSASAGIEELAVRLAQSRFGDVIIMIDACRDFPFRRPFRLGSIGLDPGPPIARKYQPRIFLLQATSPGDISLGTSVAGKTRGDFTVALLDALSGAGVAKVYAETEPEFPYIVTWSTLTNYLTLTVPHQSPRGRGEGDIIFTSFSEDSFDSINLMVNVSPKALGDNPDLRVRVRYSHPTAIDDPQVERPGPAPVSFTVPPRRHQVAVATGNYWGKGYFDAYADTAIELPLTAANDKSRTLGVDSDYVSLRGGLGAYGRIEVRTEDPATFLRIKDQWGLNVLSGIGSIRGRLTPGLYVLVTLDARGKENTEYIDVAEAHDNVVQVSAPETVRQSLTQTASDAEIPQSMHWASEAAKLVWRLANISQRDKVFSFVIAGAGEVPQTIRFTSDQMSRRQETTRQLVVQHEDWWAQLVFAPGALWYTIELWSHTLTVPGLPGALTAVLLGDEDLTIRLYDNNSVNKPDSLALLDRSQYLLASGYPSAALRLARESHLGAPVSQLLQQAIGNGVPGHGLAWPLRSVDSRGLLPTRPWTAFVDRPASSP